MSSTLRTLRAAGLGLFLALPGSVHAVEILFAFVENSGAYVDDGQELAAFIDGLAGYNVTQRFLNTASYADYADFDQIWVYDLAVGTNNNANQAANYLGIANWFNARTQKNLITDGRIISSASFWTGSNGMSSEGAWIQNYASEMQSRGGGLVLGTDHADVNQPTGQFVDGINQINDLIGINPFFGFFGVYPTSQASVDPLSPLFLSSLDNCRADATQKCINDNSTTSFAPAGLQPNGLTLTPVAYHGTVSTAFENAAVSATFGSRTFGTCGNVGQPPCDVPEPAPTALFALALLAAGGGVARRRRSSTRD